MEGHGMTRRTWLALGLAGIALVLAGGLAGYRAGAHHARNATWRTGRAYVGLHQVSVQTDGWTYGFDGNVQWIDAAGVVHDGDWPSCVDVPPGTTKPLRFAAVDVRAAGSEWRPVVMVSCR
jgi:hypothetical protein